MATYARYYKDDTGAVEWTNFVELAVLSCTHTISRDLEVLPGNAGGNTYRDDQRYTQKWDITADVDRRTQDFLRGCVTADFTKAALRVYDEYSADYYTTYDAVKLLTYSSKTSDGGNRYTVSLTVVK